MEYFKKEAIETSKYKPATWLRYVVDTFVIWGHGVDEVNFFLQHLNSQHSSIQFIIDCE